MIDAHAVEIDADGCPIDPPDGRPAALAAPAAPSSDQAGPADGERAGDGHCAGGRAAQSLTDGRAELRARLDKLLQGSPTHEPNRKLLGHLATEREHLLSFLDTPGVQATNWRAEQAIRPAVVNRKHWGGNRTWHGADTQQVLMSVIRSARQQNTDPVTLLCDLQRRPEPQATAALKIPTLARQLAGNTETPPPARGP